MSWTQAICEADWNKKNPDDRIPFRLREEFIEPEVCSYCGEPTVSGMYVRDDPKTVPFPRREPE